MILVLPVIIDFGFPISKDEYIKTYITPRPIISQG